MERALASPDGALKAVAYSLDGALLAGATRRGTVIIWETATGRQVETFPQPALIGGLAFQAGGRSLLAATEWRPLEFVLDTRELIDRARALVTRPWSAQECQRYLQEAARPASPRSPRPPRP